MREISPLSTYVSKSFVPPDPNGSKGWLHLAGWLLSNKGGRGCKKEGREERLLTFWFCL